MANQRQRSAVFAPEFMRRSAQTSAAPMSESNQAHWQQVYTKPLDSLSWTAAHLNTSLALLRAAGLRPGHRLIDVGSGASTLVDDLLASGFDELTCLDLSDAALHILQQRLGSNAARVQFLSGSVCTLALPQHAFDAWHDRAVAHFLTTESEMDAYRQQIQHALKPGGIAVLAGFAPDGPERCSGLPVCRRDEQALWALLGRDAFSLMAHQRDVHLTPSGRAQSFCFAAFRKH